MSDFDLDDDFESVCAECGAELPPFAEECPECAREDDATAWCPECGAEVFEEAQQCQKCGAWITPALRRPGGVKNMGWIVGVLLVLGAVAWIVLQAVR